ASQRALFLRPVASCERRGTGVVVWRRDGPDAGLWLRRRRASFPRGVPRRARAAWRRALPAVQARVRCLFLPQAPRRGARHRGHFLRRLGRGRIRARVRDDAQRRRPFHRCLRADTRAPQEHAVRRARARFPGVPARPLRGIQPRVGSRNAVRTAIERAYRSDPAVDAAAGALALRVDARSRHPGSRAVCRFSAGPGLARMTDSPDDPRPARGGEDDALAEKRISGEQVYAGALLDVRRDRARLPDGGEAVREYIVHRGAVLIVPVKDDGRFVIERQFRYPHNRTFLEFPAGKLDPGESALATGMRELIEESGYTASVWTRLGIIHPVISYSTEAIELYAARGLAHVGAKLDHGEFLEIVECTEAELYAAIDEARVTDAKTIAALLM